MKIRLLVFSLLALAASAAQAQIWSGQKGKVRLRGEAPQEIITAESAALVGKLDISSKKFNFKQPLNTFSFSQGELQKKHAEESALVIIMNSRTKFVRAISLHLLQIWRKRMCSGMPC